MSLSTVYNETVEYLYALQKFGTKLGLENTRALLELLGRPDRGMKYLHVTGTNGKGSVSALAASALTAAGVRTGLYTSPHLVSFTERMKIDGVEVTEDEVVRLAGRLKALLTDKPGLMPTFFEFTTAMAFDHFADSGAEAVVLEVGMGGRLDSTNVITPECSVITNVELEHKEYLGNTILDIAREKAGIIKPGVTLVTSENKPDVIGYIEGIARELSAPVYRLGRDFRYTPRGYDWEGGSIVQTMDYHGPDGEIPGLRVPLAGIHQLENAAVATCALGVMAGRGMEIDEGSIREGFMNTHWPGRLEVVSENPMLVLDGAHNPASAARLAESIRTYFQGRYRKLILVVGVLADKDFSAMLSEFLPLADTLVLTQADYERAVPAEELAAYCDAYDPETVVKRPVSEALEWALSHAGREDMVLITGSLYVVGETKALLEKKIPFLRA